MSFWVALQLENLCIKAAFLEKKIYFFPAFQRYGAYN
jgi:hypothetical protein